MLADRLRATPVLAATVFRPVLGRTLQVHTDQPGIQFYFSNFLKDNLQGKGGVT